MTQTNIDSLFQAIAPTTDRAPNATRTSGNGPGFDDHLSKASTSICSPPSGTSEPTTKPSPTDQTPVSPEADKTRERPPAPQEQDDTGEAKSSTNKTDGDERSDDDADDATAAAAEAVQVAAGKDVPQKPEPKTRKIDHTHQVHAKDAVANKKDAAGKAQSSANVDVAKSESKVETTTISTALATVESQQEVSKDEAAQSTGTVKQVDQCAEPEPTKSRTKDGKRPVSTTKGADDGKSASAETQPTQIAIPGEGVVAVANTPEQATTGKQVAIEKVTTDANQTGPKSNADDNSTDDKPAADVNSQKDAEVSATKVATAAIANSVVANVTDTSSKNNDTAKESNEKTVKPISAKVDPPMGLLDRLNRAASDLTGGTRSTENNDTPRVDPARFVGRVAKAFQTANERGGTLQLRLSPPELGALRIQLTVKDGVMSAALETESAGARRVLLDHLPALRDRLAEQNIRIEKFDVDVRQEGSGGQANPHGSNQNPYQPQPDRNAPRSGRVQQPVVEVPVPALSKAAPQISSSGINLFV